MGFACGSAGEESACTLGDLGWEDPLEKGTATHSSILAWRIPWTEIPQIEIFSEMTNNIIYHV